jgi:hypothetical protein
MKDTRGPDAPIPDSVPDELVEIYGAEARHAVRSRRSWRVRQAGRFRRAVAGRDLWYLTASALLWAVILAGFGGTITLAAVHWPVQTLDGGVLVAVAAASSFLTAFVLRRRAPRPDR